MRISGGIGSRTPAISIHHSAQPPPQKKDRRRLYCPDHTEFETTSYSRDKCLHHSARYVQHLLRKFSGRGRRRYWQWIRVYGSLIWTQEKLAHPHSHVLRTNLNFHILYLSWCSTSTGLLGTGEWRWGKREIIYKLCTYRHTVTTRMTLAVRWAATRAIWIFH